MNRIHFLKTILCWKQQFSVICYFKSYIPIYVCNEKITRVNVYLFTYYSSFLFKNKKQKKIMERYNLLIMFIFIQYFTCSHQNMVERKSTKDEGFNENPLVIHFFHSFIHRRVRRKFIVFSLFSEF